MDMNAAQIISALGWPQCALLFGAIFLLIFRKPLVGLLNRITSIDKTGITALPNPEVQRELQTRTGAAQELMLAVGQSPVLQELEATIRTELADRGLAIEGETTDVLVKYLAAALLNLEFEQIHGLIFASQISLLKSLNEVAGQGQAPELLRIFFDVTKSRFPDAFGDWSLRQYLDFLMGRRLLVLQDERYHITNKGKEYLIWMARNGKSEINPI